MSYQFENKVRATTRAMWVAGFLCWSMLMLAIGAQFGALEFLSEKAMADGHGSKLPALIKLENNNLAGVDLGEWAPYEPEAGDLIAKGVDTFYSADEQFGLGIWESKPGSMVYNGLEYDELMYIIDGSIVMTSADGQSDTFTTGEGFVLPKGWTGTLAVPEGGVRKIWVAYMGGKKGE